MRGLIDFPEADAVLDRRLDRHGAAPVALALSGGGDSMALLHLAHAWAGRRGRKLLALTVDHGLNPDSGAWTEAAGQAARALGVEWRALRWSGDKPHTGLPAAARAARHRLLADAAREGGASVILFAHTANDVAEGEIMRAGSTPALGHLREWSPSPVWPEGRGVFVLRPLLKVRRGDLRRFLSGHGAAWLEDPANDDIRYARPLARAALAASGVDLPSDLHEPLAGDMAVLGEETLGGPDGVLAIQKDVLESADAVSIRRFLSMAALCASGRQTPPRGPALERLQSRLKTERAFVTTLVGARIEVDDQRVSFMRESGEADRSGLQPLCLRAGETAVWDGRFEIRAAASLTVAPLAGLASRLSKADRARVAQAPAAARPSLPMLLLGNAVAPPAPFGAGPATARALALQRLSSACGLIARERDIARGMADGPRSSYVEALALA